MRVLSGTQPSGDLHHRSRHLAERDGALRRLHVGFDDPPLLAADAKSEHEALDHYRRVRDEIRTFVETLPEELDRLALSSSISS